MKIKMFNRTSQVVITRSMRWLAFVCAFASMLFLGGVMVRADSVLTDAGAVVVDGFNQADMVTVGVFVFLVAATLFGRHAMRTARKGNR